MSADDLAFDEISALCRTALSSQEIYALDQAIIAELIREIGRLRRAAAGTTVRPVQDEPAGRRASHRPSNGKLKLAGA